VRRLTGAIAEDRVTEVAMQLEAFQSLVDRLAQDVPDEYLDGVAAIDVSRRTVPHPVHPDVFTLGECIPVHAGTDEVVSRIVLYHGSFRALAALNPTFDWEAEARETLLHELRHHLEWQAGSEELEQYDWAVEQNHLRMDGERFDPLFYQAGETVEPGISRVEDDVFYDRIVRAVPGRVELVWHGQRYEGTPAPSTLPLFLALDGLLPGPRGDVYVVFRRRPRVFDLFRMPEKPREQRIRVQRLS
jgi:hypothetical protein